LFYTQPKQNAVTKLWFYILQFHLSVKLVQETLFICWLELGRQF